MRPTIQFKIFCPPVSSKKKRLSASFIVQVHYTSPLGLTDNID
jgi:hypothetical protein